MAKFNTATKGTKTTNLAGGEAFTESPKLAFVSLLLTSFVKSQFYRTEQESIDEIKNLYNTIADKLFVAKAALFARVKFGMRSVSHVVAGEIAKNVKGEHWLKPFFDKVIYRVDDMTEILSYYLAKYGKPIPNSLKKGFAQAFGRFDEYQLAKYRGENKAFSLIDVVNLVHPKPSDKNKDALSKLVKGELVSKDTWESELTQAGQKASNAEEKTEFKKEVWSKLIKEKKIGYFALLRNLRNIIEQAPDMVAQACELLTNREAIKKSLVLPFRFSTAMQEIEQLSSTHARTVVQALSDALDISMDNVPVLKGKTLVVLDESGSMEGKPIEIGSLFASVLYKKNDALLMTFSHDARFRALNPNDSTMTIARRLKDDMASSSTDFHSIFRRLSQPVDRIVILSDMQGWVSYRAPTKTFAEWRKQYNCDPVLYSFDLQGYGTLQFPEKNVYALAGFSEKIFDIMQLLETDKNALIKEIEKMEL